MCIRLSSFIVFNRVRYEHSYHVVASFISLAATFHALHQKVTSRSFRCFSFSNATRFAGLTFDDERVRPKKQVLKDYFGPKAVCLVRTAFFNEPQVGSRASSRNKRSLVWEKAVSRRRGRKQRNAGRLPRLFQKQTRQSDLPCFFLKSLFLFSAMLYNNLINPANFSRAALRPRKGTGYDYEARQ